MINKIAVIGAGVMGKGIAQVAAQAGCEVRLVDVKDEYLDRALKKIEKSLTRSVEKGRISEEVKKAALLRILPTTNLEDAKDCDFVIEAVIENVELKKSVFKKLDKICPAKVTFASNTSTIPITDLASSVSSSRAEQFIGMHFINPVSVMKLVEVIKGLRTNPKTAKITKELAERFGKIPIEVNDYPGFITNRVIMPMINEAIYALMEGVATKEAIDEVMKLGFSHPRGPLALADLIGLDTCLHILEVLYDGFGDPKYRPCPLLRKMVQAGYLGSKSGEGFYKYD